MKLHAQAYRYPLSIALSLLASSATAWQHYGGDEGGSHYSSLQQINTDNVSQLEQVWSYSSGEIEELPQRRPMMGFNGTPILLPEAAGQSLVLCSALNRLIALDPTSGAQRWRYDPEIELGPAGNKFLCRGISYWEDSEAESGAACTHRVFMTTKDLRLIAVDGRSGQPCADFGDNGQLRLNATLSDGIDRLNIGDLQMSAPPVIIGNTVITGFADNTKFWRIDSPRGQVLAFDARTGEPVWSFNPVPTPEDHTGPKLGGGNVWSMMSVDSQRGLVFMPTATAGPNNFGGYRPGNNDYANSVVAVNGESGEVVWHFQMVHHDVWDLDIPSQPILVDIEKNGVRIPAVIQLTKMGLTFVLHRETGEPLFDVEERPVPTQGVAGEQLSPTQPYPVAPAPLVEIGISPDDAWGFFSFLEQRCREEIAQYDQGGLYQPVSLRGRASLPGLSVNNWGGASYDPASNLLVVPINRAPMFLKLWVTDDIPDEVMNQPRMGPLGPPTEIGGTPYSYSTGPLLSPMMTPCVAPPWGELAAIDMNDGSIRWRRPLGTLDKLARMPLPLEWGTPLSGGPASTAGGITFIGASADEKFRAFDTLTGEKLWEAQLPSSGMATPMTYEVDGKQYVVIAAGGHLFMYSQNIANQLVAFALPDTEGTAENQSQ